MIDRNHRIANLEDGKLFKKHQDYIKKLIQSMQIRKEMVIYQTLLLQIVGWLFGLIEKETKKDAEMKTSDNQAIQTTLENLWELTNNSTITRSKYPCNLNSKYLEQC